MRKTLLSFLVLMLIALLPTKAAIHYELGPEGFENGVVPAGWTQQSEQGSVSWAVEGGAGAQLTAPVGAHSGSYRIAARGTSGQVEEFVTKLITPAVDLTRSFQPQLVFSHAQAARAGYFDTLRVYYRLSATAPWNLLQEYTTAQPGWTTELVPLPGYTQGAAYQVAFEITDHAGLGVVLDDISIFPASKCEDAEIVSTAATSDEAVIGFSCNGEFDNFEVVVSTTAITDFATFDFTTAAYHQMVTDFEVTVPNLQPYTVYYVYVRTDCPDNESGYTNWVSASFKTTQKVNLPYTENFEQCMTYPPYGYFGLADGWTYGNSFDEVLTVPYVYTGSTATNKNTNSNDSTRYVMFCATVSTTLVPLPAGTSAYIASPEINGNLSECEVSFWGTANKYVSSMTDDYASEITVGVMTDPADFSSFTAVKTVKCDIAYKIQKFTVGLSSYTGTGKYIAFVSNASKPNLFAIDNVSVYQANTYTPTEVRVFNALPTGFEVSAQTLGADSWNVKVASVYNRDADAIADSDVLFSQTGITAASYKVSLAEALIGGKMVVVYTQAVKNGVASTWSFPVTLRVPTSNQVVPLELTFNSGSFTPFHVKELVNELHQSNTTTSTPDIFAPANNLSIYPTVNASAPTFEAQHLNLNGIDNYFVLPYVASFDSLEVFFRLAAGGSVEGQSRVAVGVMVDPYDLSTFTQLGVFDGTISTYCRCEQELDGYTGAGHYVAFRALEPASVHATYGSYNCLDNVILRKIPTCRVAKNLSAKALITSAIIKWETNGMQQFLVNVYPVNNHDSLVYSTIKTSTGAVDSVLVQNLTNVTTYEYTVQTICGTDTLAFDAYERFTTARGIPYSENFNAGIPTNMKRYTGKMPAVVMAEGLGSPASSGWYSQTVGSSYQATEGKCIGFNWYSTYKYWITTPNLSLAEATGNVQLTFDLAVRPFNSTGTSDFDSDDEFAVLISTDGGVTWPAANARIWSHTANATDSVSDIQFGSSNNTVINHLDIDLTPYVGQSVMIAFGATSESAGADLYLSLDNILVRSVDANCMGISSLSAAAVSSSAADVAWAVKGAQSAFVSVTAAGATVPVFAEDVTVSPYRITGLNPNTLYNVFAYQTCYPGDTLYASFRTDCAALTPEQLGTVTFTNSEAINCWRVGVGDTTGMTTHTNTTPYVYSTTALGKVLYFDKKKNTATSNYGNNYYAIMPELTVDSITDYQVSFAAGTLVGTSDTANVHTLYVGVTTDPNDPSTLEVTDTINLVYAKDSLSIKSYIIGFDNYMGDYMGDYGKYITFLVSAPQGYSNNVVIDNVRIEAVDGCHQVIDLEADKVLTNGAVLTWSSKVATTFELAITEQASNAFDPTATFAYREVVTGTRDSVTSLADNTLYYAYIRAICGVGDTSAWSSATPFRTECSAITTFPWQEDFTTFPVEDINQPCWQNEHLEGSSTYLFTIVSSTENGNATNKLKLPDMQAGNLTRLELPLMNIPAANAYEFAIDVNRVSSSKLLEGLIVLCESDSRTDTLGWIPRGYEHPNKNVPAELKADWYTYYFTIPAAGDVHIVLLGYSEWGNYTCADNLLVRALPACPAPKALVADSITTNSARIKWQGSVADHIVEVSTTSDFAVLADSVLVEADTMAVLTNLLHGTKYFVRARLECEGSEWSTPMAFSTAYAVPFFEDFNAYTSGVPENWTRTTADILNGAAWTTTSSSWNVNVCTYVGATDIHVNTYSTNKNVLATPSILFPGDDNSLIQLTFDVALTKFASSKVPTSVDGQKFAVLCSTDEGLTWTPVYVFDDADPNADASYSAIPNTLTPYTIDLTQYKGQSVKVAFEAYSSVSGGADNHLHLDNVRVSTINAACAPPTGVKALGGDRMITLSWNGDSLKQTVVELSMDDDFSTIIRRDTVAAGVNTYDETGLLPITGYYARVKQLCADDASTDYSTKAFAKTNCGAYDLPWYEGFETSPKGTTTSPAPDCWNFIHFNEGSYPYAYVNNSSYYVKTGSQSLYFQSSSSKLGYVIFPEFVAPLNELTLSFAYRCESSTGSGHIYVGYITDVTADSTFVQVAEVNRETTWKDAEVSFLGVPDSVASTARIAICYGGASQNYYLGIDDIVVKKVNLNCPAPAAPIVVEKVGVNSVQLRWDADSAATYVVDVASDAAFQHIVASDTVSVPSAVISKLKAVHSYTARYALLCSETDMSDFSKPVGFTTLSGMKSITPIAIGTHSASFRVESNDSTVVGYQYGVASTSANPDTIQTLALSTIDSLVVSGLDDGTSYAIFVRAFTATQDTTEWKSLAFSTAYGLPFAENFNSTSGGVPAGWNRYSGLYTSTPTVSTGGWACTNDGTAGLTGNYLYVNLYNTFNRWVTTPDICLEGYEGENIVVSFDFNIHGYNSSHVSAEDQELRVLVSTNAGATWSAIDNFVWSETYLNSIFGTTTKLKANLSSYAGQTIQLAFYVAQSQSGSDNKVYIDNVLVDRMSVTCDGITAITGAAKDIHTLKVQIKSVNATDTIEYVYTAADTVAPNALVPIKVATSSANVEISGLLTNTAYKVYARSLCAAGDTSAWFGPVSISTSYLASVPYVTGFDNPANRYTVNGYRMEKYWTVVTDNASNSPRILVDTIKEEYYYGDYIDYEYIYSHSSTGALSLEKNAKYRSAIISPYFDRLDTLMLSFQARAGYAVDNSMNYGSSYYNHTVKVGTLTDASDLSTFQLLEEITLEPVSGNVSTDPDATNYWRDYRVSLAGAQGHNLVFLVDSADVATYLYIDDLSIDYAPICQRPGSINIEARSTSEVLVRWTGNSESYTIEYTDSTGLVQSVVATADSVLLTNLYSAMPYSLRILGDCGNLQSSEWSSVVRFNTPVGVPYLMEFESEDDNWTRARGLLSDVLNGTALVPGGSWSRSIVTAAEANMSGYAYNLNIWSTDKKDWLLTPEINLSEVDTTSSLRLSFTASLSTFSGHAAVNPTDQQDDKFAVVISADGGLTWDSTNVTLWDNQGKGLYVYNQIPVAGRVYHINLSQFIGQTIKIGFYGESTLTGGDNRVYVDNVVIDAYDVDCAGVDSLQYQLQGLDQVLASWTTVGNDTVQVVLSDLSGAVVYSTTTSAHQVQINGLTPNTSYHLTVAQVCGSSPNFIDFTTPRSIPFVSNMSDPNEWAVQSSGSYKWEFKNDTRYQVGDLRDTVARFEVWSTYNSRLISPVLHMPALNASEAIVLECDMASIPYSTGQTTASYVPGEDDEIRIEVSEDNGKSWRSLATFLYQNGAFTDGVQTIAWSETQSSHLTFDFGKYSGKAIQFAIYAGSTEANKDIYVLADNVNLHKITKVTYDAAVCNSTDFVDDHFFVPVADLMLGTTAYSTLVAGSGEQADTLFTLNLTVNAAVETVINDTICEGQLYDRNGIAPFIAKTSVVRPLFLTSTNGCDSLVTVNIHVLPTMRTDTTIYACKGSAVEVNGKLYYTTTVVVDTLQGVNTCDSISRTFVTFSDASSYTVDQHRVICKGDTYTDKAFPDGITAAGTYTAKVTSLYGCDSTVTVHITLAEGGHAYDTISVKDLPYVYAEDTILGDNVQPGTFEHMVNATCGNVKLHITVKGEGSGFDHLGTLDLSVAPNPARVGQPIEILSDMSFAADYMLQVYDAVGHVVYRTAEQTLTIPGLPVAGFYTVRVSNAGETYQAKLLVK